MKFYYYWFQVDFRVLRLITNLPLYGGVHWSAFFRNELRQFTKKSFADLDFCLLPDISTGNYHANEIISIRIATNEQGKAVLQQWLLQCAQKPASSGDSDHFILNKTIELAAYEAFAYQPEKVEFPQSQQSCRLTLIFPAPLRLKRSDKDGGRYFDPFHFQLEEFISRLAAALELDAPATGNVRIIVKSFIWLDVAYQKTIGGIIGGVILEGIFSEDLWHLLHWGQFCGLGKNRSFGFGFYYLEEFPHPLFCPQTGAKSSLSFPVFRQKLLEMAAAGDKGVDMTAQDLLDHPEYIYKLVNQLADLSYKPALPVLYKIRKKSGGFRKIAAYLQRDKLVLAVLTDKIDILLSHLMTSNCYAYRKGYSYHLAAAAVKREFEAGFSWGFKLDIASFFESVSVERLIIFLKALAIEPALLHLLRSYFKTYLIQGNTLSPLLSNLAMLPFDRWFRTQKNLKLIRYADDMVIIGRNAPKADILQQVKEMLASMGLSIKEDKFAEFTQSETLNFLGYTISEKAIFIPAKKDDAELEEWLPYPKLAIVNSKPLYLSFSINYAYTKGNSMCIQSRDNSQKVLWKDISRILILGKPRLSGGVIYRAIQEQVPIHFLTVHGRPTGGYIHYNRCKTVQEIFNSDGIYTFDQFSLDFVREIAFTKIINQYRQLKKREITIPDLTEIAASIFTCTDIDVIRGKEGYAARIYFEQFRKLVEPLPFASRSYHPPDGPVNVLLSLGYSFIYRRFSEALRANGIDPFCGIFHQGRGNHEALASDLVECYRFLIDRITISLINKKLITGENFYTSGNSSWLRLDSLGFRNYIRYFENTMKREVKIKERTFSYEVWMDKTVVALKNALELGTTFRAYRSL